MRILFLTDNFPPETNAPATRTYEHCLKWINMGYNVTVITCFPNFPKGRVFEGYTNKLYQKENIDTAVTAINELQKQNWKITEENISLGLMSLVAHRFGRVEFRI